MRILHIIDSLSPAAGGPPEAIRQLALAYEHEVTDAHIEVVCLDRPDEPFLSGIPCPVHALNQSVLGRFAFSPRLWRWLHHHARRFDLMVMNGIWTFPDLAVRSAARRAGIPYAVFVHGALDPWFNRKYPLKRIKKWLYWWNGIMTIALVLFVQIIFLWKVDLSTVRGVLYMGIATAIVILFVNAFTSVYGFMRGPRQAPELTVTVDQATFAEFREP